MKRSDYDALEEIPGAILKPRSKRNKSEGRQAPGSSLTTYAKLKPRNEARHAEQHAESFGPQAQACREIGICCCCGKEGQTEPHHYISRGAGGRDEHCVPMLHEHHMIGHAKGWDTFWRGVGIDPAEVAYGMAEWVKAGRPRGNRPW